MANANPVVTRANTPSIANANTVLSDDFFVHLNVHSDYSQIDSTLRIDELVKQARERRISALALTDEMNICGAVKFYGKCIDNGIKPIIGAQLLVHDRDGKIRRLTALALNDEGYYHLCELITRAYRERKAGDAAVVRMDTLAEFSVGIAVLVDLESTEFRAEARVGKKDKIYKYIKEVSDIFIGETYLEIHRINDADAAAIHTMLFALSESLVVPIVATNAVRFLDEADYAIHQIRIAISDGLGISNDRRQRRYFSHQYLKTGEEMRALFADAPQIIDNTLDLARKCTNALHLGEYFLPDFPIPEGYGEADYLAKWAREGLSERLKTSPHPIENPDEYAERLGLELSVIDSMGFNGYFLIVADFIQWAKAQNIPVGPGRGSGAGSIAAWVLKITDIDPIRYGLLFERFLNPERVSMPDFDIDFCQERREEVIQYVTEKYGKDNVGQIITFGTLAAKNSIRDVGRVLGYGYNQCDTIARLVPTTPGITLKQALSESPELQELIEFDDDARTIFENAQQVEGLTRNFGTHAAGVVIGPKSLPHYTAVYSESRDEPPVVQFNMKDIESAGLVKFDFLGLTTLTIIDHAARIANSWRSKEGLEPLDVTRLEPDDATVFKALSEGDTHSVFQMESTNATDLTIQLQPDIFEEIIDLMAINRPGPLGSGMDKMYIDVKHKRREPQYLHPSLEPILSETKGVILYQEQVMEICRQMAGYSLGEADLMRRAMGKKILEEMESQAERFISGAQENGVDAGIAQSVFDLIAEFANYGFNKSHSAAYAVLAYQTAYLKVHYRAAFYVANLNLALNNTTRIVSLLGQAHKYEIEVAPPSINDSISEFIAVDKTTIRYGMGAIKGVGDAIVEQIVAARQQHNDGFASLFDFFDSVGSKLVNKRVFEALVKAGAFDNLHANRAECLEQYQGIIAWVAQQERLAESGQIDLFSVDDPAEADAQRPSLPTCAEWPLMQRLAFEREVLGYYLKQTPIDIWRNDIAPYMTRSLSDLDVVEARQVSTSAGTYVSHRIQYSKNGEKLIFVQLRDGLVEEEIVVRGEEADAIAPSLTHENVLLFQYYAYKIKGMDTLRRTITGVFEVGQLMQFCSKTVEIRMSMAEEYDYEGFFDYAYSMNGGEVRLNFHVFDANGNKLPLVADAEHGVQLNADSIIRFRHYLGHDNVKVRLAIPWKGDNRNSDDSGRKVSAQARS